MQEQRASGLIINPELYFSCPLKGRGFQTNVTRSLRLWGIARSQCPKSVAAGTLIPWLRSTLRVHSQGTLLPLAVVKVVGIAYLSSVCIAHQSKGHASFSKASVSKSPKKCFHWLGLSPVPFPGWVTVARDGLFSMAILASEPTSRVRM